MPKKDEKRSEAPESSQPPLAPVSRPGKKSPPPSGGKGVQATDEKAAARELIGDLKKIAARLEACTKVKPGQADTFDKLQKAVAKLPPGDTIAAAIDEFRTKAGEVISKVHRERVEKFRTIEAAFIRQAKSDGTIVRESAEGWRVGKFEVALKREQAQCRLLYNHEPVTSWTGIAANEELFNLYEQASKTLDEASLPASSLADTFWDAYDRLRNSRARRKVTNPERVPILEFYTEFRIALTRHELQGSRPDKKLRLAVDVPRWSFLYNLDRYRSLPAGTTGVKRLGFETCSQREGSKRLGVTVNGLDADRDYKQVCHVQAVGSSS